MKLQPLATLGLATLGLFSLSGCGGGQDTPINDRAPGLVATDGEAQPLIGPQDKRQGLQIVLLHRFNSASMAALNKCLAGFSGYEIASEPYLERFRGAYGDSGVFGNVKFLAKSNRGAVLVIHFGFHSGGRSGGDDDNPTSTRFETRGRDFYRNVFALDPGREYVLVPSLEDEWTRNEFRNAADSLLQGFLEEAAKDRKTSKDLSKISLRRSSNTSGMEHDKTITKSVRVQVNGKDVTLQATFNVGGELHGPVPTDGDVAYSNDGNFVWFGAEDKESMKNAGTDGTKWPLVNSKTSQGWKEITRGRTGPVLLWRPAYNLFPKKQPPTPVRYDDGASLTGRKDNSDRPLFDSTEVDAVKAFLGK